MTIRSYESNHPRQNILPHSGGTASLKEQASDEGRFKLAASTNRRKTPDSILPSVQRSAQASKPNL